MFSVEHNTYHSDNYMIMDENRNYMHRDGSIVSRCSERWPTREQAQAVLDKYQPPHVWEHGDVFKNETCLWIYLEPDGIPRVLSLDCPECDCNVGSTPSIQLSNAEFLFNIKEKL